MKKSIFHRILSVISNKYFLVFTGFAIWIVFFDQQNLIERYKTKKYLENLQNDTLYYQQKIKLDEEQIRELKTSPENLEKFAREQFQMKAPDEDIFIIRKEEEVR